MRRISVPKYWGDCILIAAALVLSAGSALAQADAGMAGMMPKGGCCGDKMGKMPGGAMTMPMPAGMSKTGALPSFPGDAHIYHLGATGFFLDYSNAIPLDAAQTAALTKTKEQAMAKQASMQGKIDQTEQELWLLTASDQPDLRKIDGKVREIEKLTGDQRIAFIRAVGDAASILTREQRAAVLGKQVSDAPAKMGGMGDDSMGGAPMNMPMKKEKKGSMRNDPAMPGKTMPMSDGHM
jgi:Spy/CpxP family protein refolding chaperone